VAAEKLIKFDAPQVLIQFSSLSSFSTNLLRNIVLRRYQRTESQPARGPLETSSFRRFGWTALRFFAREFLPRYAVVRIAPGEGTAKLGEGRSRRRCHGRGPGGARSMRYMKSAIFPFIPSSSSLLALQFESLKRRNVIQGEDKEGSGGSRTSCTSRPAAPWLFTGRAVRRRRSGRSRADSA
jgi:hypothetical protein